MDGKIPLDEIPNLTRALGFYPTQKEIENMQQEINHLREQPNENLILNTFVKLFLNHKPVYGLTKEYLQKNFEILSNKGESIPKQKFIDILQNCGEKMTEQEIKTCFLILTDQDDQAQEIPD